MPDFYFDRRASVTIGKPSGARFVGTPLSSESFRIDSAKIDSQGKYSEGFRIVFEITKTDTREPNTAKIEIYNLANTTASKIGKRDDIVILEAGYGDVIDRLYVGDITRTEIKRQGVNRITTIECGTAANAMRTKKMNEGFAAGTKTKDIFAKAAESLGLPLGDIEGIDEDEDEAVNGFSASGLVANTLDKIVGKSGAQWSVQDGALTVQSANPTIKTAVLLTPQSGLIGAPEITDTGIKFKSLLISKIAPTRFVQIESENMSGFFLVKKCVYRGDTRGGGSAFTTEGEAIAVNA
jgi:hypothetical protein